jgi:hypothetical protein
VRWEDSSRFPRKVWTYQLLPNNFSPEIISNVMTLCSFGGGEFNPAAQSSSKNAVKTPKQRKLLEISVTASTKAGNCLFLYRDLSLSVTDVSFSMTVLDWFLTVVSFSVAVVSWNMMIVSWIVTEVSLSIVVVSWMVTVLSFFGTQKG